MICEKTLRKKLIRKIKGLDEVQVFVILKDAEG